MKSKPVVKMCPGSCRCAKSANMYDEDQLSPAQTQLKRHTSLHLPRGSETTVKQSGSALKVFNKAETGTDMPDTNIHYCKVIAKSSCKIALCWPIP